MSDATNALAALGISTDAQVATVETVVVTPAEVGTVEAAAPAAEPAPATEPATDTAPAAAAAEPAFSAGSVLDLSFDDIPETKRAFAGGGKTIYGIEDIAAPGTDGKKYHAKLVPFEGGDVAAFKRSVQSSATGQNTKAKDAGAPNYYITRSHEEAGKFVGVVVIRTDDRPADKVEEAAAPAVTTE